jgi:hypothetical protein
MCATPNPASAPEGEVSLASAGQEASTIGCQRLRGQSIVACNEAFLTAKVDGELLAMSVDHGICYGLNSVATRIWALLENPCTVDALCAQLTSEFDVDKDVCQREVVNLLEKLRANGMVIVKVP